MNYSYFTQLENGELCAAGSEQAFMEKILVAVFSEREEALSHRVNDLLQPKFSSCDAAERSLTVSFVADEWMLNPNGTLHGGVLTTAVDMTMTVLGRYLAKKRTIVTAQLSMTFLRSIQKNEEFSVAVKADHVGRRSIMLRAEVAGKDGKQVATASAVLM